MDFTPTSAQRIIYDFVANGIGNGIIDAVAGAGKTTTLMECVEHIPDINDVLYCAFNTSIRKEIQKKFHERGKSVAVKTIHSLGFQIIRSFFQVKMDREKYRKIIENADFFEHLVPEINKLLDIHNFLTVEQIKALQERRPNLNWDEKNALNESAGFVKEATANILAINDKYRLTLCESDFASYKDMVDHFLLLGEDYSDEELGLYIILHQKLLKEGNSIATSDKIIDYTDMLYLPTLLQLESKVQYGFVFVDECQDLSRAQLAIVKKYVRPGGRVLAVGDPYQSIYGFAGADSDSFKNVKNAFDCQPLMLTDCFRCPTSVIELAQTIREDIKGFKTEKGITRILENRFVLESLQLGDLVICRHRRPLLSLALKLVNKDVRIHLHPDEVSEFIGDYKRYFKPSELLKTLTEESIEQFLSIVRERNIKQIQKDCDNVDAVLREMKIKEETELLKDSLDFFLKKFKEWQLNTINSILLRLKELMSYLGDDAIKISTIHRAKGLENERVFILEYNKLPIKRKLAWENIQERNLHYVAVTRPKKELYLCVEEKEPDEVDERIEREEEESTVDFATNPPFIIDEETSAPAAIEPPHIAVTQNRIRISAIITMSNTPKKYYSFAEVAPTPYPGLNTRPCQMAKYWAISEVLQDTEYSIQNVICTNWLDAYFLNSPNGVRIYDGHYNAAGTYRFMPRGTYEDNEAILTYLKNETNYPIAFEYKPQNNGFEAVHSIIVAGCSELGILITNIYREGYNMVYCLKTPSAYAYFKLSFNGRGIITTLMPYSSLGNDDKELQQLLEIISHLWQR